MKKMFRGISVVVLSLILLVVGYVVYMQSNYYRIEDNLSLKVDNNREVMLRVDKDYSAVTYNIGFGAYDQKYSFFMDEGKMKDGTKVKGKSSRAISEKMLKKILMDL